MINIYIKEFSECTKIPSYTLKRYEKRGILVPFKLDNGYRWYTDKDISKIKELGFIDGKNYKYRHRTYNFNRHYFDNIDNTNKAYWLGFLWGDCSIIEDGILLTLATKDVNHLLKFKRCLSSDYPIKNFISTNSGYQDIYNYSRFSIYDIDFKKFLGDKYGLIKNRTDFSLILHNVNPEYHKDLLRGLIDADGSLGLYKNSKNKIVISLIASDSVLDFFQYYINKTSKSNTIYKRHKRHENADGDMRTINITGNYKAFSLIYFLYNNADIYLDRKYEIYTIIMQYVHDYIKQDTFVGSGSTIKKYSIEKYIKQLNMEV